MSIISKPIQRPSRPKESTTVPPQKSGSAAAVGVLLPVRLETRFYPPAKAGASWHLRLRIVPDRASLDAHDPQASEEELTSVEQFWQEAKGEISGETAEQAWSYFVARHGGPRANWLARRFPPQTDANGNITIAQPSEVRKEPLMAQLRGFPPILEIWMARGGVPQMVERLAVDPKLLDLSLPDYESPDDSRWWLSFETAKAAGLAAEIDLGPAAPDNIDVLYVIGLGDEPPDDLLQAHADAGLLGLIAPGTPTNTIHGEAAADLATGAQIWLDLLRMDDPQIGAVQVSQAMTGAANKLGPMPGGEISVRDLNQTLVRVLWPVLWSHPFRDVLGLGSSITDVGIWAGENLLPEGPLPAIRIGNLPYGLLPATSLDNWEREPTDLWVEETLRPHLQRLRQDWAAVAESTGTTENADTQKLLDLLGRTPSSNGYAWRNLISLELLLGIFLHGGFRFFYEALVKIWRDKADVPLSYAISPQRHFIATGWPQDLAIPLVTPDNLPEGFTFRDLLLRIYRVHPGELANGDFVENVLDGQLPNSLLIRLLIAAKIMAAAEVTRYRQERIGPIMEHLSLLDRTTQLQQDAEAFEGSDSQTGPDLIFQRLQEAILTLAGMTSEEIERPFKAVLDTAIYRIDPWVTAYSWRRLKSVIDQGCTFQLGVYGWVDRPRPGAPGPTDGGLLHAPSTTQAYTSIVLRDRAIHDPEPDRWHMDLTSAAIRKAAHLAEEVRLGQHLHGVLGHEVERVVGAEDLIKRLRQRFPLRTEHAGRRVCNGKAVLDAAPAELQSLGLTSAHLAQLEPLREAIDAYGDLLLAEGVFHTVSGRAEMAGAAMEAAAGLAAPPQLDMLETPRSGRSISTTVAFCIAAASSSVPPSATASPTALADPSLVRWLFNVTAAAVGSVEDAFNWQVTQRTGETDTVVSVTLDDLALRVYDLAVLTPGLLHQFILNYLPNSVEILPGAVGDASHQKILELITMIGGRPALPEHLVAVGNSSPSSNAVLTDLRTRLANLRTAAAALINFMQGTLTGSVSAQRGAMRNAARWGIVPQAGAHRTLPQQVEDAIEALNQRLAAAPDSAAAAEMDANELGKAIAELTAPDGRYPVLSLINRADLPTQFTRSPRPTVNSLNTLDTQWLSVNAVVRPSLAPLEAHQMAAFLDNQPPPLHVWSNRPTDPWQLNAPLDADTGRALDTELIVVYGPAGVMESTNTTVACCLVDSWNEVVPSTEHVTTAAFGFDAPAARAPQAILLAVPPRPSEIMDGQTLMKIVSETRELAHARMAIPADLAAYASVVSPLLVPGMGNTGVILTPSAGRVL